MADENSKRNKRGGSDRNEFIETFKDNRIVEQTRLSRNIYRIYRRTFDTVSRSVVLLRFYSRISGLPLKAEAELTRQIMAYIEEVRDNIDKKVSVSEQMLTKHGVKTSEAALEPVEVTIIDPLANYYLKLLGRAHQLDTAITSLWLATILDDNQRRQSLNEIENELGAVKTKVRALSYGVRERFLERKQVRAGKSDAVDVAASEQATLDSTSPGVEAEAAPNEKTTTGRKAAKAGFATEITDAVGAAA